MGKVTQSLVGAFCILAGLLLLFFVFAYLYGKRAIKVGEDEILTCYTCEARRNYPDEMTVVNGSLLIKERTVSNDIEGCLNSPQYKRQCEPGQYCAVLHQKLNEIQRVVRTCSAGGKLGCNSEEVEGIKEKACFCNSNLCIQIPFFYE